MIEALAYIKQGRLTIENRKRLIDLVLAAKDGQYRLTLSRNYPIRSINENNYYWGTVIPAFMRGYKDENGIETNEETAHWLLAKYCNGKSIPFGNEIEIVGQSTSKLVTVEYEAYLERCRHLIAEFYNIEVMMPEKDKTKRNEK